MNKFLLLLQKNPHRLLQALLNKIFKIKINNTKACITNAEIETLQKYAGQTKFGIVEIGVLDGGTTREMALVTKSPIYGIDPLIPDSMAHDLQGNEELIKKNLQFYKQFYFFKDYSYNLIKNWDKKFDFIFIDGDHRYESVKQDFSDWSKKLELGGYTAFHDSAPVTSKPTNTHRGYDGPIKLVEELKNNPDLEYIETVDSITIFKKIK